MSGGRAPVRTNPLVKLAFGVAMVLALLLAGYRFGGGLRLGGAGTFFGPFVGALTFLVLEDRVSLFTESWPLVIGAIFVLFVLFLPRGIWGTLLGGLHGSKSA